MKYLNKLLAALLLFAGVAVRADDNALGSFVVGNTGTTSATAIVPQAPGYANVTDLIWDLDANLTSGTVDIRPGKSRFSVTSATSASGTTLWLTNSGGTAIASGDYVIYFNNAAGTYTLLRTKGTVTTTSVTVQETISPATATTDVVWSTQGSFRRNAPDITSSTTMNTVNIWLPPDVPSAFTVDGNTTACKIQLSGVRSAYRN